MNATPKEILHIFETIRASGNRLTDPRKEIVVALYTAKNPKTIAEIATHVSADETSVYRTVELLVQLHIIEEIVVQGGVRRFALAHGHHHHIVCESCGLIAHIPCDPKKEVAPPKHPEFTRISDHEVTYYGLCTQCVK